mmetsp:Transcript_17011/g.47787  ORF Transcript_17011/g.47787 Transcript_17011/m.47787 type:complete len:290 (+) Transcript_17011:18-887(+)
MWEPMAPASRPVLGSFPATAHLNSGELTMWRPKYRACFISPGKLVMATRITWDVPSPLRTMSAASPLQMSNNADSNSAMSTSSEIWLDATRTAVSLVDSSPSTDMALKDSSTAARRRRCRSAFGTVASVRMYASMVAMLGSIMPAPLAIPTTRAPFDRVRLRTLGKRSVVMMALAASSTDSDCKFWIACGTTSAASSLAGSFHPMTPVDDGRTESAESNPSASATDWQTSSASASPSPPEHTLETLLLMTNACSGLPLASRFLPTLTGAPGNRFDVNTAAQLSVGPSVK